MFGGLDAFVALAGLIIPPAVDFVRKRFLKKGQDTPEATMSTLATTRPDVLPEYVKAQAGYMDATVKYFNRDVCGIPAQWVVNCRAIIRPLGVTLAAVTLGIMVVAALQGHKPDPSMIDTLAGIRLSSEAILSSWFGDRISISK